MLRSLALFFCAVPGIAAAPARSSPEWLRSGIIYQVNTRTFSPQGNFAGVTAQLPRLKQLGVNILWLMPIHPIGRDRAKGSIGSPYAVRDYEAINPAFGTAADLHDLVAAAHRQGFKVIVDIVANHTSWDSTLMKSPSYYHHDAAGNVRYPEDWTDVAWLDYGNPDLRQYMTRVLVKWVKDFDLDGFRCDVAFMVPVDFWEQLRAALDQVKPDIVLLAEAHQPNLVEKAFDLDYSWPLHSALTNVFENGEPADRLQAAWIEEHQTYPTGALHLHFSDNHDEKRALVRFGERGAMAASALMFTLDGVPMLYNGMEVGDTTESGAPALFENLPVFWSIAERRPEFLRFYRQLLATRNQHAALQQGELQWLTNSAQDRVLTYIRRNAQEEIFVAINCSSRPWRGSVDLRGLAEWTSLLTASDSEAELPSVRLSAWGYAIYRHAIH